ncbi:WD40 repeat domain-containing protein [Phormidesmis sp. 146-35]
MLKRRGWLILGVVATIAVLTVSYFLLGQSIAARLPQSVCVSAYEAGILCYRQPKLLFSQKTTAIATSPNGKLLASTSESTIYLWDLQTERFTTLKGHKDWVSAIAFSPDGQILASASLDRSVKLWSLKTGALLATFYTGRVTCLTFSPDGRTLATGSRLSKWADGSYSRMGVQFWDVETRQWIDSLGDQPVTAIAYSPNGTQLAIGNRKTQIWQLKTQKLLHTLNSGDLTALLFTPDGEALLTASSRIKQWDVRSGDLTHTFSSGASDLALSPDGVTLATGTGGTVQLWQLDNEQLSGILRGSWHSSVSVEFGLGGRTIVSSGSDGIRVWRPDEEL